MATTMEALPEGYDSSARPKRSGRNRNSITGFKRQRRGGGSWQRLGGGQRLLPAELAIAGDFRLPRTPATDKQAKTLEEMIQRRVRHRVFADLLHEGLSPETIAGAMGVKQRTAYSLAKEVRQLPCQAVLLLVLETLSGMASGKLAGVLGTRKCTDTEWLFGRIDDYGPARWPRPGVEALGIDFDDLRVCHAAFRLDYRTWQRQK